MDPNSTHQIWSLWIYTVRPEQARVVAPFQLVRDNCARFGRKAFGAASQMHIRSFLDDERRLVWEIKVRTEGHPVHDPAYVAYMHAQWDNFLRHGFGPLATITTAAKLEAGDRQDGTPADQLIIIPSTVLAFEQEQ